MKFRTTLAAAVAVAMLGGLAACGGDDDNDTASPGTSSAVDSPVGGSASEPSSTPSHGAGHSSAMITMADNSFSPASLTVAPGTTVMVMNEGAAVHDLKDEKTKGEEFDSGDIAGGQDGSITAPDEAGDYPYICTYHFGMKGTLTVE